MDPNKRARRAIERTRGVNAQPQEKSEVDPAEVDRVYDALRRLPRRQRAIFLAIRIDDLSYAEIAEQTGLSLAGVEKHFARAIGNLMRNMHDPKRHWWRRWL